MSSPSELRPAGVIHDIGYRPYAGDRLGEAAVAWSLFRTGVRNCFGLGRSTRSKVLPMSLLGAMLLPAVILVAVLVQAKDAFGLTGQIVPYARYPMITQVVISVFVAAQAPALISRDLRFRTITLYLARPLRRSTYALVRLASLLAAVFALIASPLLVLYVGGLLADLPPGRETKLFLGSLVGALVLAAAVVRAGRADRRPDHPSRPGRGRHHRRAGGELHRRGRAAGSGHRGGTCPSWPSWPGCSIRTPWSTVSRSGCSASRPPRRRHRPAAPESCSP